MGKKRFYKGKKHQFPAISTSLNVLHKSPSTSLRTFYLYTMLPDYPHKLFADHRSDFNLLMETLAMDNL